MSKGTNKAIERKYEGECTECFNQYGFVIKNKDAEKCRFCGKVNHPMHTGIPDRYFTAVGGLSSYIESKGFEIEFPFAKISEDQWNFVDFLEERLKRPVWIYLTMGTEPVNSQRILFRRQAWLFRFSELRVIIDDIKQQCGVAYLPLNFDIAMEGRTKKAPQLNARELLREHALVWSNGKWTIPPEHKFTRFHS